MIYKTKRIELHPFTKDNITQEYLDWFQDPIVTLFNSHGLGSYIRKDAEQWLEDSKNDIIFGIWAKDKTLTLKFDTLQHIGNISLQSISNINRSAELAIIIGNTDYWGNGYATEALTTLIDHGFKRMNLHRIWSGTAAPNLGMRKVFDKLGFIEEGIFVDGVYLNGRYEDVHVFGLLKDEWIYKGDKDA